MMAKNFNDFCQSVQFYAEKGNPDKALALIRDFVIHIISRQTSVARIFSSKSLDALCQKIGSLILQPDIITQNKSNNIVYAVTELAQTGGHTRVMFDLIKTEEAAAHIVLISGINNADISPEVLRMLNELKAEIKIAPAGTLTEKVKWLQKQFSEINPKKTYTLLHHFDAVFAAALQPQLVGKLIFIHNCDTALALGLHIPGATHVDLHAKGYYRCQQIDDVQQCLLWPLIAQDEGSRLELPFFSRGHMTTCTSGGFEKFESHHYLESLPYAYEYPLVVPEILKASSGTHIHIGPLSDKTLSVISAGMDKLGIAQDRFINIPYVASLWKALLEQKVDVYIGSFPLGGGRATVEAMGCGMPMIIHSNYRSHFLSVEFEVYPKAMIWRSPNQLLACIEQLKNINILKEQAAASRAYYEHHHSPQILSKAIKLADLNAHLPLPLQPSHNADLVQNFLDHHNDILEQINPDLAHAEQLAAGRFNS
jgi:hypothetical protein